MIELDGNWHYNERERSKHRAGTDPVCHFCTVYLVDQTKEALLKAKREEKELKLDPDDKFDSVIIDMVKTNRKKRRDYAADADIFSNFRDVAHMFGHPDIGEREIAYILILVKVARLRSLRLNGRMDDATNESVLDTFLDLAVYSTITLALTKEEEENE